MLLRSKLDWAGWRSCPMATLTLVMHHRTMSSRGYLFQALNMDLSRDSSLSSDILISRDALWRRLASWMVLRSEYREHLISCNAFHIKFTSHSLVRDTFFYTHIYQNLATIKIIQCDVLAHILIQSTKPQRTIHCSKNGEKLKFLTPTILLIKDDFIYIFLTSKSLFVLTPSLESIHGAHEHLWNFETTALINSSDTRATDRIMELDQFKYKTRRSHINHWDCYNYIINNNNNNNNSLLK